MRKARWYIQRYLDYHHLQAESLGAMEYATDKGLDQDLAGAVLCLSVSALLSDEPQDLSVRQALAALERAIGVREARAND